MRLRRALEEYVIGGIETTIPLHQRARRRRRISARRTTISTGSSASSRAATDAMSSQFRLTPDILLQAYAAGIFPMAESADDPELFWVDPKRRGILPLDAFHVPRRLRRVVRAGPLRGARRHRLQRRSCAAAPRRAEAAQDLDQRRDRAALHRAVRARRGAQRRMLAGAASWSAGSTACRSARAFFGESMFSRVDRRQQGGARPSRRAAAARRLSPARHAVPDAASGAVRRDRDSRARAITACSPRRCAIARSFRAAWCRGWRDGRRRRWRLLAAFAVEQLTS